MKKRLLPILLALVLTVSLAVPAFASDVTSGRCGENAYWRYSPAEHKLTITGSGAVDLYQYGFNTVSPWRYYNPGEIHTVVVGEGITELVGGVFDACLHVTSIKLPSTLKVLSGPVFFRCGTSGMSITLPDGVTNVKKAFRQTYIGTVHLGKDVTFLDEEAFAESGVHTINLEHVKQIGKKAFYNCQSLRRTDLSGVEYIGQSAFARSNLEQADLRSLRELGYGAFSGTNLKTVVFGKSLSMIPANAFEWVYPESAVILGTTADRDRLLENTRADGNEGLLAIGIEPIPFADVMPDRWSAPAVNRLAEAGIINGFEDGTFRPEQSVTRAQFSKMLSLLLPDREVPVKACAFSDVESSAWYADFVMKLAERGIVNGVGNGLFRPDAPITRQDMATMISRMIKIYGLELPEKNQPIMFSDASQIADYALAAVSEMQRIGVINGFEDGSFRPQANASREQTAQMLSNLMQIMEQAVPAE